MASNSSGKVYLTGAGPGAVDMITVRAAQAIAIADVVVYDHLVNEELLNLARGAAELIYAGKRGGGERAMDQSEINRLLVERARAGKQVVRLKGGDPFIFGRGGEEAAALVEAGVEFEVIPGVTSAIAVPAFAGIPLTHRDYGSFVAFVTGHQDETRGTQGAVPWDDLATRGARPRHAGPADGDGASARDCRTADGGRDGAGNTRRRDRAWHRRRATHGQHHAGGAGR